jgi:hypothetical protein
MFNLLTFLCIIEDVFSCLGGGVVGGVISDEGGVGNGVMSKLLEHGSVISTLGTNA